MKKKIAILTLVFYLFTSVIVQPQQKTHAFAFAPPVAGGALALGAIALGGLATYVGLETYGDEISDFGNLVWDKTNEATKLALNSVTTWVQNINDATAVPNVKIDTGAISDDMANSIKALSNTTAVAYGANHAEKIYRETADSIDAKEVNGIWLKTQFPTVSLKYANYGNRVSATFSNDFTFMVSTGSEVYFSQNLVIDNGALMTEWSTRLSVPTGSQIFLQRYVTGLDTSVYNGKMHVLEDMLSLFASYGVVISVINYELRNEYLSTAYNQQISEAWESMKDAGLIIDGSAILESNPNVTWDGTTFVDAVTGVPVATDGLVLPRLGVKDGVIGYPVAGDWVDVTTGVPTAGTGDGAIPGEGGSTGILQGLWDWLKGILKAIYDAIVAIGVALTTGLVGDTSNLNWDKLKTAGTYFTTKFPFSLPWDIGRALTAVFGQFDSQNVPSFDFNFYGHKFEIKLPQMMVDWFPITRAMILIAFDIGLIYSVRKLLGGAS